MTEPPNKALQTKSSCHAFCIRKIHASLSLALSSVVLRFFHLTQFGPRMYFRHLLLLPTGLICPLPLLAQNASAPPAEAEPGCSACAEWNAPQRPFQIHGNSYYVGPHGLGAVLVTSPEGHVLIDGALPESAPLIAENIRTLGFSVEDVRLILNSHVHFDHAGGIAQLQRASGAEVAASPASRLVLLSGESGPDDPQYGKLPSLPAVERVREIADGETLRVGTLALTAHFTPGHTPGGTTWTWRSCEGDRCLDMVYADSQTPVSADGFEFTHSEHYPTAIADFERGHAVLERLSCDILVTTHPAPRVYGSAWRRASRARPMHWSIRTPAGATRPVPASSSPAAWSGSGGGSNSVASSVTTQAICAV